MKLLRKPRSYKATDKAYKRAMKVAKKRKTTLAKMVEEYIESVGEPEQSAKLIIE
jgi:hypothetical protein